MSGIWIAFALYAYVQKVVNKFTRKRELNRELAEMRGRNGDRAKSVLFRHNWRHYRRRRLRDVCIEFLKKTSQR